MIKYKLNKELIFGIKEIDSQHQHLIDLVNKLNEKNSEILSRNDFLDVINEIISYAHVHFNTEEKYFKKLAYPESSFHIKEHQKFLMEVNELFLSFDEENIQKIAKELPRFLNTWIQKHLMQEDKKFAKFYLNKQA